MSDHTHQWGPRVDAGQAGGRQDVIHVDADAAAWLVSRAGRTRSAALVGWHEVGR